MIVESGETNTIGISNEAILLITDGCSNMGLSPVLAAAEALEEGITVNVVGVIDYGTIGELGSRRLTILPGREGESAEL